MSKQRLHILAGLLARFRDWRAGVLKSNPSERVDPRMVELTRMCSSLPRDEQRDPRGSLHQARLAAVAAGMRQRNGRRG